MAARRAKAPDPRGATVRILERESGALASAAVARMDATLTWFRAMPADERSWITLVAQAGIGAFVAWYRHPDSPRGLTADVFGTAPRELARVVSLQQTVELVRVTIEVVEERGSALAAPGDEERFKEGVLVYAREVAFAAAQVYAQAAESRGAWDARLEALVADALIRGEFDDATRSRATALGWGSPSQVFAVAGRTPDEETEAVVESIRRGARHAQLDVVTGVHGAELVAVLGGATDPIVAAGQLSAHFGPGPVVAGPPVADLAAASRSASAALAGLRAAVAWPDAPRPVSAADLLPERVLDSDATARRELVDTVYRPLERAGGGLLETASAVLEGSASLEAAARRLFVHPNTVRYRLRRIADVTGRSPSDPRDAATLRTALTLGRLDDREASSL
jgi:DNA-binding PucR family transcriptional regulator